MLDPNARTQLDEDYLTHRDTVQTHKDGTHYLAGAGGGLGLHDDSDDSQSSEVILGEKKNF